MWLFGKSKKSRNVNDVVYISTTVKWNACCAIAEKQPTTVFIAWFPETQIQLKALLKTRGLEAAQVLLYREASAHMLKGKTVIMAEHYPLQQKESQWLESAGLDSVTVYSALDEPLFKAFGSDNITRLMKAMGMQEDEPVSHAMISSSIQRVQDNIAGQITLEQSAQSQAEWFRRHVVSEK